MSRLGGWQGEFSKSAMTWRSTRSAVHVEFEEARSVAPEPDSSPALIRRLTGARPAGWQTLEAYRRLRYPSLYDGTDLEFLSGTGGIKSEFRLAPGASASRIRIRYQGMRRIELAADGALQLETVDGVLRESRPVAWQEVGGKRKEVTAAFTLAGDRVGFWVGKYDPGRELVIDPLVTSSTYFGGSGFSSIQGVAADLQGNVYVTGWTETRDLTNPGSRGTNPTGVDAFVAKIGPAGLLYLTYLGGTGDDRAWAIAVDSSGNAVVAGQTNSVDFPLLSAAQTTLHGSRNAFVASLNGSGALNFSTYLGGTGSDIGRAVAVDLGRAIYVAGSTASADFPVLGAFQVAAHGGLDGFVTKFSSSGAIQFSTYLGGAADDQINGIAVDSGGSAIVTGGTFSTDFPVANPIQASNHGGQDAFIAKLSPAGNALSYSTYWGGSTGMLGASEEGNAVAVDNAGNAYVAGVTSSLDFPVTAAWQSRYGGGTSDAFALKISSDGRTMTFSTYLGGSALDWASAIAVDPQGQARIGGYTVSQDFPLASPLQAQNGGDYDGFVAYLDPLGALLFSTYLGGLHADAVHAVAFDGTTGFYSGGNTLSTDFPLAAPLQNVNASQYSGFLTKFTDCQITSVNPSSVSAPSAGVTGAITLSVTPVGCVPFVSSNTPWLSATAAGNTVSYTIAANTSSVTRSATITISGTIISVLQAGVPCSYSTSPSSLALASTPASGSLQVTPSPSDCGINASANVAWLSVSVQGGLVLYTAAANPSSFARNGTISISGTPVSVSQSGASCTYLLSMTALNLPASGASGTITVTPTPPDCPIAVSSNVNWASVGVNGVTVAYAVGANTSSVTRSATFIVAGINVAVVEAGQGCSYAVSVSVLNLPASGGTGSVVITPSPPDCPITASSSAAWVTASVNGNSATYSVAANSTIFARTATLAVCGTNIPVNEAPGLATMTLSRASYNFGITSDKAYFTSAQPLSLDFGGAPVAWTIVSAGPYVSASLSAGTGKSALTIAVIPSALSALTAGQQFHTTITVSAAQAANAPQTISIAIRITPPRPPPPAGFWDIPVDGTTGVVGAVALGGWALSDIEIAKAEMWREPNPGEAASGNGLVYIGVAVFLAGSRPDVEAAFPNSPWNYRAGWGALILTNMLPSNTGSSARGNGVYKLHMLLYDTLNQTTDIGPHTITVTNAAATKPFGTIDTPVQGQTVSGTIVNFGWVLTPQPYLIPLDGSTLKVVIDNQLVSYVNYGYPRSDIQTLFPGYANTNTAVGYYMLDTTKLSNGIHFIAWGVADNGGRTEGIGSRLFYVNN